MNVLEIVDQLIRDRVCRNVYFGSSAMAGRNCFATLVGHDSVTIATGAGDSAHDALADAIGKLPRTDASPTHTRPAMPGMTRSAMPGFGG